MQRGDKRKGDQNIQSCKGLKNKTVWSKMVKRRKVVLAACIAAKLAGCGNEIANCW